MTATANTQVDSTAVNNNTESREDGTMNYENNNINTVTRFSNSFRMGRISKVVATAALGLALAIGLVTPGSALGDTPSVSSINNSVVENLNDDFSLLYGIPDNGPGRGITGASALAKVRINTDFWNDDFSMVYGIPDVGPGRGATSASAPAKVMFNTAIRGLWNDDFSMVYGIPDIDG